MADKPTEAAKKREQELRAKAERDRQRLLKQLEQERAAMKANKNTIPPNRRP